ncbi:MAG: hypothetical protein SGI98_06990 [Verrucomicrobiota bacterium]|nr:hypothetical protein [Verrucomicrobiota bacterium]
MIFPVVRPSNNEKRRAAAIEIEQELINIGAQTVNLADENALLEKLVLE